MKDKPADNAWPTPKANGTTYKVLHISDVHVDPEYKPGMNSQCGNFECCRQVSGKREDLNGDGCEEGEGE